MAERAPIVIPIAENAAQPTIKIATSKDEASLIDVLVLAFSSDPAARWTWPAPHEYLTRFPRLVKAFGAKAFTHESAFYVDDYRGAALWLPPDVHPDEDALINVVQGTVSEKIRKEVAAIFERMGRYHPSEPHWFLPLIGIDPSQQGKGYGSALMKHALARCDRDKKLAYLESSNPKNVPLYERHGFELLGSIQVGTSPTILPMLRKPR